MTAIRRFGLAVCVCVAVGQPGESFAQSIGSDGIKARHIGVSRMMAAMNPRSEGDQRLVDGWPLYRTERGQAAFNDAMATLKATDGPAPQAKAFAQCPQLQCNLKLPDIGADGWLQPGRMWVSPSDYVLIVHSPRNPDGRYRRRSVMDMRWFVFHEFHNSSRNTDMYDTISSHKSSVFVPFYMSKQATDAKGRRFVTVVQVAPHDVYSIHASNKGSSGPGIEVAKNTGDALEPLQATAGILVATMSKNAVPRLQVVNHRGVEGKPMLDAYDQRVASLRNATTTPGIALPFVLAQPNKVVAAAAKLDELLAPRDGSRPIAVADRGFLPRRQSWRSAGLMQPASLRMPSADAEPALLEGPRPAPRPMAASSDIPQLIGPVRPAQRPVR